MWKVIHSLSKPRRVCMPQSVLTNDSWPKINTIVKAVWMLLMSSFRWMWRLPFHNFYGLRIKVNSVILQLAAFSIAKESRIMSTITFFIAEARLLWHNMSEHIVRRIYGIGLSRSLRQNDSCMFQRPDCLIANL